MKRRVKAGQRGTRPANTLTTWRGRKRMGTARAVSSDASRPGYLAEGLEPRLMLAGTNIGDLVWNDLNSNGLQDAGEPGVAGVSVELYSSTDSTIGNADDVLQSQALTDANGHFTVIANLAGTNNYYLIYRAPVGYSFTGQDQGGNDAADSDANAGGVTGLFAVTAGQDDQTRDAGMVGGAPGFGWAVRGGSATNEAAGYSITVDGAGNTYLAGYFKAKADFDPYTNLYELFSAGGADVCVAKYAPSGELIWVKSFGGTSDDKGRGVAVGTDGSVYTVGSFSGTVDFDPGSGTFNLSSVGSDDVFVSKLDAGGNFVWARSMGGSGSDIGNGLAVGSDGSIYTTGQFYGTADFDPGAGTFQMVSAGSVDIFVSKLDAGGNFVWGRSMGGSGTDIGRGVAAGAGGTIYITGYFGTIADFDPGADTFQLACAGIVDIFVSKLDANGTFVWAKAMGGKNWDQGFGLAVGADGSVYTTGLFQNTIDFDPGAGVFELTSTAGSEDAFISKLDADGNFVWAKSIGGSKSDAGYGLALGTDGSIHATGSFMGTVDFDPGVGTFNLSSASTIISNIFVLKLDVAGSFTWAKSVSSPASYSVAVLSEGTVYSVGYAIGASNSIIVSKMDAGGNLAWTHILGGGSSYDMGFSLAVATDGSIYTAGYFNGEVDFDPGSGIYNLRSAGYEDAYLVKYSPGGGLIWARRIGGSGDDVGYSLAVLTDGSVIITGTFQNTVDFDPGGGTYNLTSTGYAGSSFVLKLDASGNFVWARNMGGGARDIAVGMDGSIYLAGSFIQTADFDPGPGTYNIKTAGGADIFVCKLDSAGDFVWARAMGGTSDDRARSLALATDGSVYTTGFFHGTADFDPGSGVYNLSGIGNDNVFISKIDVNGNFVWARTMEGSSNEVGYDVAIGLDGSVYTTGYFLDTVDFDPGSGTSNLTSTGSSDVFVSKLDDAGNFVWAKRIGGSSTDHGFAVALDADGGVYTTGKFSGTVDFDPGSGTFNLTSGVDKNFVCKLDSSGNFVWAWMVGYSGNDVDDGDVAVGMDNNVYVAGSFYYTGDFDPRASTYNLTSAGGYDFFVSRLLPPAAPTDLALSSGSVVEHHPISSAVGSASATDGDAGESFTYTLVSGAGDTDNALFTIVGNQLRTAAVLNYADSSTRSIRVRVTDYAGLWFEKQFTITVAPIAVAGRWIFYNHSSLDNNDPAANAADDAAIDPAKSALLPGGSSSAANFSGFSKGITGVMVDVLNLYNPATISASDFVFEVADSPSASTWSTAPAASSITVRSGAGSGGSDRVTITWASGSIVGQWLRVRVKAANTGLAADDVFFFASQCGDSNGDGKVDFADLVKVSQNYKKTTTSGSADGDFNGDGKVDFADLVLVSQNYKKTLTGGVAGAASYMPVEVSLAGGLGDAATSTVSTGATALAVDTTIQSVDTPPLLADTQAVASDPPAGGSVGLTATVAGTGEQAVGNAGLASDADAGAVSPNPLPQTSGVGDARPPCEPASAQEIAPAAEVGTAATPAPVVQSLVVICPAGTGERSLPAEASGAGHAQERSGQQSALDIRHGQAERGLPVPPAHDSQPVTVRTPTVVAPRARVFSSARIGRRDWDQPARQLW